MMGLTWFRQGEIIETATREAMDVIQAKTVNANANTFKFFEVPASVARAANAERFEIAA
jgi:hypothetical protein